MKDILKWLFPIASVQFLLIGIFWTIKIIRVFLHKRKLKMKISDVRMQRKNQFDALKNNLSIDGILITQERSKILKMSATDLISKMRTGTLRVTEVLQTFQAKALEVTGRCNCVVEFITEAEEWAKAMDKQSDRNAPLFGLPVSLKEGIGVAGHHVTMGCAKYIGIQQEKDGALVYTLKKLGAIPFCRTNVPQILLTTMSCNNPIYGETTHPLNSDKTPGGSSGGEAALISSGGSVLGFGSDMAGSVRVPAHFCGIAAFKPTHPRISTMGQLERVHGALGSKHNVACFATELQTRLYISGSQINLWINQLMDLTNVIPLAAESKNESEFGCWCKHNSDGFNVRAIKRIIIYYDASLTAGILAENVDTVILAARSLFSSSFFHEVDPSTPTVIWKEELFQSNRKLRVGFLADDTFTPEVPSCRRALTESLDALRKAGHDVIDFNHITKGEIVRGIIYSMRTSADTVPWLLKYEPWDKRNIPMRLVQYIPKWIQSLFMWIAQLGSRGIRKFMLYRGFSSSDVWFHFINRRRLEHEVTQQWKALKLDVVMTCAYPFPAVKPKYWTILYSSLLFSTFWNFLNFPAGVLPVTVQTEEDRKALKTQYRNGTVIRRIIEMASSGSVGLPVGVQIVGLPWEEETVLRAMKELENVLKDENKSKIKNSCHLEFQDETTF